MREQLAAKILVVDDEPVIRDLLAEFLGMEGFAVHTAEDGEDALVQISRADFDLVLSDLKMPRLGGIELLEAIGKLAPAPIVVLMTGFGTVETAIGAMKRGAFDYILKPFKVEEVVHTLRRALEQSRLVNENLRLKEALSLYKVSEAIAASISLDEVIETVTTAALNDMEADHVIINLDHGAGGMFERVSQLRPGLEICTRVEDAVRINTGAVAAHFDDDFVLRKHGESCMPYVTLAASGIKPVALAVAPILVRAKLRGLLAVVRYQGVAFTEGQRKLLKMVADRAGTSIETAKLYHDLQATFHQTIEGLASAIDKMDRYTRGHSERVAAYAQLLAIKLGLPEDMIELARQGALLHDIGKIGCVMNLNKPGKLSQGEYEIFKQHPDYGLDILSPITFLHPLIPAVHLHHERWDGEGYPVGLKALEIPLLARIISVADTYDAMTSDRAYRKALPHAVAIGEIARCCGSQFDPDIAHPFQDAIEVDRQERRDSGRPIPS